MPFGLTAAPRVFTKLLVTPVAHLRCEGVTLHPYLDDILIRPLSRDKALQDIQLTLTCLHSMGLLVKEDKSSLSPTQHIEHLGLWLDIQSFRVSLSQDRQQQAIQEAQGASQLDVMWLAKLLGLMVSCQDLVTISSSSAATSSSSPPGMGGAKMTPANSSFPRIQEKSPLDSRSHPTGSIRG